MAIGRQRKTLAAKQKKSRLTIFRQASIPRMKPQNQVQNNSSGRALFQVNDALSPLQAEVLKGTELESASIGQIRLRLFKIAARLKASVRRIHIELCTAYPLKALFSVVHQRLSA